MELKKLNVKDSVENFGNYVKEGKEIIIYCLADDYVIGHGIYEDFFDRQYCVDNNLYVLDLNFPGGACVVKEGDINFLICTKGFSEISKKILEKACEFLKQKGLNVEIDGNDLIILENEERNKVGSFTSAWMNNDENLECVAHISMSVDNDLIEKICKKPMEKIPKGLEDYGIKAEEIIKYLNENIEEFNGELL